MLTPPTVEVGVRHNRAVRKPESARKSNDSRFGWLLRRPLNWWLRLGVIGLIIFGGGFLRLLFKRTDAIELYVYATVAALALVSLVAGLLKARKAA